MTLTEENRKKVIEIFKSDPNVKPGWAWDSDYTSKRVFPFVTKKGGDSRLFASYDPDFSFTGNWMNFEPMSLSEAHKHWPEIYPKPESKYHQMKPEEAAKFLGELFVVSDRAIYKSHKIKNICLSGVYTSEGIFFPYKRLLDCKWVKGGLPCGILEEGE